MKYKRSVLIGWPLLDIEDGLAGCFEMLLKEGFWGDAGLSFCD